MFYYNFFFNWCIKITVFIEKVHFIWEIIKMVQMNLQDVGW